MGLFSFLKNAGAKLTGRKTDAEKAADAAASDAILNQQKADLMKSMIENLGLAIDYLDVKVDGDRVLVSGTTKSHPAREKVILALGNIDGIAEVEDNIEVIAPDEEDIATVAATFYTVVKGDTLGKIAKAHYGNAMKYPVIFEANKPMLENPDRIYPGQVLRIPPLDA